MKIMVNGIECDDLVLRKENKKKISIYELLGLIKDGKAPKKVLVDSSVYEYNRWGNDYNDTQMTCNYWLFKDYTFGSNGNRLDKEIEILDEEDEFIDIEEIEIKEIEETSHLEFKEKINDLIKNQRLLINKLKEEGK